MKFSKPSRSCIGAALLATLGLLSHADQHPGVRADIPDLKLVGTVLHSNSGLGIALVSMADGRSYPLPIGGTVGSNWRIEKVAADEITIRSGDGRTAKVVLGAGAEQLVQLVAAPQPLPVAELRPIHPTPAMIYAATVEFELPAND